MAATGVLPLLLLSACSQGQRDARQQPGAGAVRVPARTERVDTGAVRAQRPAPRFSDDAAVARPRPPQAGAAEPATTDLPRLDLEPDLERPARRFRRLGARVDRMLDQLDLRPGSTVVDIGAGLGHYALRVAQRLRGTGRVYATDVVPRAVSAMRRQARRRGLRNVTAVLVGRDGPHGVDPFYARQQYDLLLASHVYGYVGEGFFGELRRHLRPGGKLVLISPRRVKRLEQHDAISDPCGLVEALAREASSSPFIVPLSPATRALLARPASQRCANEHTVRTLLSAELGAMARNLVFGRDFLTATGRPKRRLRLTDDEASLAADCMPVATRRIYASPEWNRLARAEERRRMPQGPWWQEPDRLQQAEFGRIRQLNTLLVFQAFRRFLFQGEVLVPGTSADPYRLRHLTAAGYRLDRVFPMAHEVVEIFTSAS